ncbi:hypothetical protein TNCV_3138511 [Trichonephila clavipes]|nr:hypothetical protein TNCV_3138511 [Trichonephila clavipes]
MKKFNQTPYKLPPPTPIHVPAEKRPLEEKALPKKRVRITPVMRRVSRRSELPMAPVQIPQTCADSRCPRTCADSRCPTITCADSRCPRTCADSRCPTITCADSRCPRTTCADSTCPESCADSRCPRTTCADSSVTSPTTTCADSTQIPDVHEHVRFQCPMSQNHLCRFQCHKS